MEVIIRPEKIGDIAAVHEINKLAYETDSEARLVDGLRREARPIISLVAELDDRVIGHILFTPVTIGDAQPDIKTMGLAPLAVHPDYQDHGIGGRLVKAGLEACLAAGTEVVTTLGHPDYYRRFGFEEAIEEGISYIGRDYDPFFMVKELVPDSLAKYQGEVVYHRLIEEL